MDTAVVAKELALGNLLTRASDGAGWGCCGSSLKSLLTRRVVAAHPQLRPSHARARVTHSSLRLDDSFWCMVSSR